VQLACNDQAGGNQSQIFFDVVVGETYYFMINSWLDTPPGNLVFNVDVAPPPLDVEVNINPRGSVVSKTGIATVSGTVTCSREAFVEIFGSVRQRAGRAFIDGFFGTFALCDGETYWTAEVESDNGRYAGGKAEVNVEAFGFAGGEFDIDSASATIRLHGSSPNTHISCPKSGNDGFEAGTLNTNAIPCWTVVDQEGGSGSWCNQGGTIAPLGPCLGSFTPVPTPPEGSLSAMTGQSGPGSHALYRCGVLRSGAISFQLYINNQAGQFATGSSLDFNELPNQQFRADLVSAAAVSANPFTVAPADVLLNLYQTDPGDPPESGYDVISTDASAFVGQQVCIRFAEADNQFFMNVGVDAVSIDLRRR